MKVLVSLISLSLLCSAAFAQNPDGQPRQRRNPSAAASAPPTTPPAADGAMKVAPAVKTQHTWNGPGGPFGYTATAGFIEIKNENEEVEAKMFYVAYTKDGEDRSKRPVTFAFNGGPGSSSVWLHMGALGPRRARMNDDGTMPAPPFELVDNNESWLPFTDVVMIDAIGTGFSRPAKPELGKKFYGLTGDLNAFTACIKGWLTEANRWPSPKIVAGESYGGIRVAGLSNTLLQEGIAVNGIISISGVINFQTIDAARGNDLPYITYLPALTATAFYHHKLSAPLMKDFAKTIAESETFANGEYSSALMKGAELPAAERKHIAHRLAELTGVSPVYADRADLRISGGSFRAELLRDNWNILGRYDARLIGRNANGNSQNPEYDPSDTAITPVFTSAFNDYIVNELKFKSDEAYRMTGYAFIGPWDYGTRGGYPDTTDSLRRAMTQNPHMKVMLACGWYDLACPGSAMKYTIAHLGIDPKLQDNIRFRFFPAGHMMYIDKNSRESLVKEVGEFVRGATK